MPLNLRLKKGTWALGVLSEKDLLLSIFMGAIRAKMTHDSFPAAQAHYSHSTENHKPDKLSSFVAIFTAHLVFGRKRQLPLSYMHKAKGQRPPALPIVPQTRVLVHACAWPVKLPLWTSDGPSAWYPTATPANELKHLFFFLFFKHPDVKPFISWSQCVIS